MIFTKIPFIYGSGIIELNFQEIKKSIRSVILENVLNRNTVSEHFIRGGVIADLVSAKMNKDFIFTKFKEIIKESAFGPMLGMIGGDSVLDNLRVDF